MGKDDHLRPALTATADEAELTRLASATVLPPRYRDLGVLGVGGMGEVRQVADTHLGRVAAMKIILAGAGDETARRRFLREARITAGLQHPGIVAVYDQGQLDDGRLWYTMKIVPGRTLTAVIHDDEWTLRRRVDAFARVCEAMAYAHGEGVVHRDLKPSNIMVGAFGEVLILDWGLARHVSEPDLAAGPITHEDRTAPTRTAQGVALGTPAYMSPEQAAGARAQIGPRSDVYSLGAILYAILTRETPFAASGGASVAAVLAGPPQPVLTLNPRAPSALVEVCERAMSRRPADRPTDAQVVAEALRAWLDGTEKLAEATALIAAADALLPSIQARHAEADALDARANAILGVLPDHAPVAKKEPGWSLQDQARAARRAARLHEVERIQNAQTALSLVADFQPGHALLADHHRSRAAAAEARHEPDAAAEHLTLLRAHDDGRHAQWLAGDGRLTLHTDPAGASVTLFRYVEVSRRLVPQRVGVIGVTPLENVVLPMGSYLLQVEAPGRATVQYPVCIERGQDWLGVPPGADRPFAIPLPEASALGADDIYVPAGWFRAGGNPEALDALPATRAWVDGFIVRRFPVTTAEYLTFLDTLVDMGREDEAIRHCPLVDDDATRLAFGRTAEGRFCLNTDGHGRAWQARDPMVLVSWWSASAYAEWLGSGWRLLHDLEWEKAARGVDGRRLPWGDHFEPTWARVVNGQPGPPGVVRVDSHPTDESPYGVRGMVGNVRDWCGNAYLRAPSLGYPRGVSEPEAEHRCSRGGAAYSTGAWSRPATRYGGRPEQYFTTLGFRLGRTFGAGQT